MSVVKSTGKDISRVFKASSEYIEMKQPEIETADVFDLVYEQYGVEIYRTVKVNKFKIEINYFASYTPAPEWLVGEMIIITNDPSKAYKKEKAIKIKLLDAIKKVWNIDLYLKKTTKSKKKVRPP